MRDALGRSQSALVLGATSDLARAITRRLVGRGARRLVLAGRDPVTLSQVAEEMRGLGATDVRTVAFEAGDLDAHPRLVRDAFAVGDIDVVLVAFGVLGDQAADEHDPAAAAAVMQTNTTATVSIGVAAANALEAQGHGTLVGLSSVAGERARRSNFIYGASKAGMDAFLQGLGAALAPLGIGVVIVRPGFVRTRMTEGMKPAPLSTDADTVATATVAAIERGSGTVWVPGSLRYVMAVLRHLPTPVFRRLPL